jgi:hypothetical protein
MKYIVMTRSVPGADRDRVIEEQYRLVEAEHDEGFFQAIYRRVDGYGSVAVVEADSEEDVVRRLEASPFFLTGCVVLEQVIPVTSRW